MTGAFRRRLTLEPQTGLLAPVATKRVAILAALFAVDSAKGAILGVSPNLVSASDVATGLANLTRAPALEPIGHDSTGFHANHRIGIPSKAKSNA